ncbi:sulfatase [uncultured Bacteroides sp.]|uniref:sulfatase n=1 Tax=uncultured Bacteroides sp. TaxID=162156 RepID=UPI002630BE89|nr:sulfatase [uncultured Bacteroides sp.]
MKKLFLLSLVASGVTSLYAGNNKMNKPNVLFILVDDMGYTDLSCTGSTFYETPNIDRLASESVAFNYAYAACPVSSPSRAAIMTGKYPARINLTDYIPGNQAYGPHKDQMLSSLPFNQHLDIDEIGLAEAFRRNGYCTFFTGKWHLSESEKYYPTSFGFDVNLGGNNTGHPAGGYFSPYKNPQLPDGPKGEYLTDRLTDEMIKFIRTEKDKPFFAFLSYYTVHLPMQAKVDKIDKYIEKLKSITFSGNEFIKKENTFYKMYQNMPVYAAMVEHLDDNIGRLMECLLEEGLDENTIVVFTSDNGGMATSNTTGNIPTSNYPLRAGKGYLYEGGIKVPLFVRWSGKIKPSVVDKTPVVGTDFYPTLLDLCGLNLLPNQHIDGFSIKTLLEGKKFAREPIFWHYPHYSGGLGGRPSAAVRYGNYKLIEFFEDNHVELYNVVDDVSEKNDLSSIKPELTEKLKNMLNQWYLEVDAKMPVKNSFYHGM